MCFPMTHLLEGEDFMAIARYPIDDWIASGEPRITTAGLIKLCIKIAEKDTINLAGVLQLGEKLLAKM